jgi:hypothetical protein
MTGHEVIHVVAVGHQLMAAVGTMLVADGVAFAFVPRCAVIGI